MLDIVVFYADLYVCIYTVVAQWQRNGSVREAVLAGVLIGFAFIILWALLSPIGRLITRPEQGVIIGADSPGVLLTALVHIAFVRLFFFPKRQSHSSLSPERV